MTSILTVKEIFWKSLRRRDLKLLTFAVKQANNPLIHRDIYENLIRGGYIYIYNNSTPEFISGYIEITKYKLK